VMVAAGRAEREEDVEGERLGHGAGTSSQVPSRARQVLTQLFS
jgi:hypothetical protein